MNDILFTVLLLYYNYLNFISRLTIRLMIN